MSYRTLMRLIAVFVATSICGCQAGAADFTEPTNYLTEEYYLSVGLDPINAAACYEQGYTGKGISVGVVDTRVDVAHPELLGKTTRLQDDYALPHLQHQGPLDKIHGTSVAGVIAAKRDGQGTHGVAFDSDIKAITAIFPKETLIFGNDRMLPDRDSLAAILDFITGTRIFNNSYGSGFDFTIEELLQYNVFLPIYINQSNDLVAVWGAGNIGSRRPGLDVILPYYLKDNVANFLSVSSFNPKFLTLNEEGKIVIPPKGVSLFSSLPGKEAALYSVLAPGEGIPFFVGDQVSEQAGTSYSTPFASGTLALVEQKYPFLNARQLVDTVLSTANTDFVAPDYIISLYSPKDDCVFLDEIDMPDGAITIDNHPELLRQQEEELNNSEPPRQIRIDEEHVSKTYSQVVVNILNPDMELPTTTEAVKEIFSEVLTLSKINYANWLGYDDVPLDALIEF